MAQFLVWSKVAVSPYKQKPHQFLGKAQTRWNDIKGMVCGQVRLQNNYVNICKRTATRAAYAFAPAT